MSVLNNNNDELLDLYNELEAKVLTILEHMTLLSKRLTALEKIAEKHGVTIENNSPEADGCSIN